MNSPRSISSYEESTDTLACSRCNKEATGFVLHCDRCHVTYHGSCVNITDQQVDKILNYFCIGCKDAYNLITIWRREKKPDKLLIKKSDYFQVEKIIKHITLLGIRYFYLKWKDYGDSDNSWASEDSMDGAIDLLQDYLREHGLPLSNVTGLMGANKSNQNSDDFNEKNWVSMSRLLTKFGRFQEQRFKDAKLPFGSWSGFETVDKLYFLNFDGHCFVLLHHVLANYCYIADGDNVFRNNDDVAREIRDLLKIRLISLIYDHQICIDHCVTSAILIGCELTRAYLSKHYPLKLIPSPYWKRRMIAKLHKYASKHIEKPLALHQNKHTCYCEKVFKDRRGLLLHKRFCTFI